MVREVVVIEAQLDQAGRCRESPEGTGQVLRPPPLGTLPSSEGHRRAGSAHLGAWWSRGEGDNGKTKKAKERPCSIKLERQLWVKEGEEILSKF